MNLIEKYIASNHFGKLIGMRFDIVNQGEVHYHIHIEEKHLATPLAAHGGLISALVDGALGVAALSAVHTENRVVSTVEYKINFLAPALPGDALLAHARVEHKGGRLIIVGCEVRCTSRNNKLISKALGTFNAYDASRAGY